MAHNICTVGGKGAIAYLGETPWHGIGTRISEGINSDDMLKQAGLDWKVEKRIISGTTIGAHELVRVARKEYDEVDIQLGRCTKAYNPLQNEEAFKIFDVIAGTEKAIFHTAGALGDGETIWVLAKFPSTIQVKGDDIVDKYMLLSNTHNGSCPISVKFTPIRVVCNNTLNMAMRDGNNSIRIKHTANMNNRLAEIPNLFGISTEEFDTAAEVYKAMANKQLNTEGLYSFLNMLMPLTETQNLAKINKSKLPARWESIVDGFENHEFADSKGTLWAAYNSFTHFIDYAESARSKDSMSRLKRVWFGEGADIKVAAFEAAKELLVA